MAHERIAALARYLETRPARKMPPTGLYRLYSSGRTMQPHLRPLFNAWAQHEVGEIAIGTARLTDRAIGCKLPSGRDDLFVFAEGEASTQYALVIVGDEVTDAVVTLVGSTDEAGRQPLDEWLAERAALVPFLS